MATLPKAPSLEALLKELGIEKLPLEGVVEALPHDLEGAIVAKGRGESVAEVAKAAERLYRRAELEE